MENSLKKLYIVSFGDSKKYRYSCVVKSGIDEMHHDAPFARLEKELNDYLKSQFPDQTCAYYTCAKVTEVDPSHEAQYAEYPELDATAIENIKHELVREIREEDATKMLNDNAPFADAPV